MAVSQFGNTTSRYWLVPPAVLIASWLVALVSDTALLGWTLLVIVAMGSAVLLIRNLPLGLLSFVFASLLIPISFGTGTQTSIGINIVTLAGLMGIWILRATARPEERLLPRSSTVLPLLVLCAVALLSFGIGQLPWFTFAEGAPLRAQLGGLATFLLSAGVFLLSATQIRSLDWLKRISWLFLAIGGLVVLSRLVGGPFRFIGHLETRGATGSLFWIWLTALAFSQAVLNGRLRRGWRIVLLALAAVVFYLNLFQHSRWASGWIPPLVAVVVILWIGVPRIGILASLGGAFALLVNPHRLRDIVMAGDNEYSLLTRLEAWRIIGEIVRASPLLGLGPANYYWYAPLFPILGYSVRFSSHNNFVDIVAQTGILGLICFLWFGLALARVAWRLLKQAPGGFAHAYLIGALGGLAGTLAAGMLGDWVIPFVYNIGLDGMRASLIGWMFLGGVVALEQMARRGQFEMVEALDR